MGPGEGQLHFSEEPKQMGKYVFGKEERKISRFTQWNHFSGKSTEFIVLLDFNRVILDASSRSEILDLFSLWRELKMCSFCSSPLNNLSSKFFLLWPQNIYSFQVVHVFNQTQDFRGATRSDSNQLNKIR